MRPRNGFIIRMRKSVMFFPGIKSTGVLPYQYEAQKYKTQRGTESVFFEFFGAANERPFPSNSELWRNGGCWTTQIRVLYCLTKVRVYVMWRDPIEGILTSSFVWASGCRTWSRCFSVAIQALTTSALASDDVSRTWVGLRCIEQTYETGFKSNVRCTVPIVQSACTFPTSVVHSYLAADT